MRVSKKKKNLGGTGRKRMRLLWILAAALLFAGGCRTLDPDPVPGLLVDVPMSFSTPARETPPRVPVRKWWRIMDSGELNGLIQDGLDQNLDLKVLQAKILQARAVLEKEQASLKPGLDFSLGTDKSHSRTQTSYGQGGTTQGSHSFDAFLTGEYSLDVWGKARAAVDAGSLDLEAARQDYEDAVLDLTAQIAGTWVDIISVRSRKEILENQIQLSETQLELLKLRFLNGKASALDVSQQREALAESLSLFPLLEKEESLLLHALGFLTGRIPGQPVPVHARDLPGPVALPDTGVPSDLLENRADIRAARMRLLSSSREVEAAKADLLPSFTLSARALFSSGRLDLLFHNWVASLGAAVAGPLLDGGLKKAEIERTRARVQEQVNAYARTVARAIQDVEDSLVTMEKQSAYIRQLELALAVARLTLKDARIQYLNGQSSYLNYLTARSVIDSLERQLISERAAMIKEEIGFHRVIGWQIPWACNPGRRMGEN